MADHPTIGTVAMGDTEAKPTAEQMDAFYKAYEGSLEMQPREHNQAVYYGLVAALSTRPAQEPVAWESMTTGYIKYVTDERFQQFSDAAKRWYKPFKCSSCALPSAAPQPVLSQPEVKALEWKPYPEDGTRLSEGQNQQRNFVSRALVPLGSAIFVMEKDGVFTLTLSMWDMEGSFDSEEAAKAAAQADYEQRILSALCPLSDIPAQAGEVEGNPSPVDHLRVYPQELTDDLRAILSLMMWNTGPMAHALRDGGQDIKRKAEDEQAEVMHWLIGLALEHGSEWRTKASDRIREIQASVKAAASEGSADV